jgi:hypothetical protein
MIIGGVLIVSAFVVYLCTTSNRYMKKKDLKYYKLKWNSMIA